jgi:hypothetical protein
MLACNVLDPGFYLVPALQKKKEREEERGQEGGKEGGREGGREEAFIEHLFCSRLCWPSHKATTTLLGLGGHWYWCC